jgi:predicted nucleotidyltransferase
MTRQCPEVERVILFGSLSRGDAVPGSDADLLVILGDSDLPFHDRSGRYRFEGVGIGTDVFAYTQVEVDAMLAEGNEFLSEALRGGKELAAAGE